MRIHYLFLVPLLLCRVAVAESASDAAERERCWSWIDADGFVAFKVDTSKLNPDEKKVYAGYRKCLDHNMAQMKAHAGKLGIPWEVPSDDGYINRSVPRWAYPLYGGEFYRQGKIAFGLPKGSAQSNEDALFDKPGRVRAGLHFRTSRGWQSLGRFWCSAKHLVVKSDSKGASYLLPFPHDRYNLTVGWKLKKGIVKGKVLVRVESQKIRFSLGLGALKGHEGGLPVGLWDLDGDQFDDASVWAVGEDGTPIQYLLDLGVQPGLKPAPGAKRRPCPVGDVQANQLYFLTREGLGILFESRFPVEDSMTRYSESKLRSIGRFSIAGVHCKISGQSMSLFVDYDAFPEGAALEAEWSLTIREHAALKPLPGSVQDPVDWANAQFFDSHGHLEFRHNLLRSVMALRKNRTVFGILSFYFCEGVRGRKFLGDWPAYVALRNFPDVFSGFGSIQLNPSGNPGCPSSPTDDPDKVDLLHRLGFHGIKNIEKWATSVAVDDAKFDGLYKRMQALNMPVVYHAGYGPRVGEPGGYGHSTAHLAGVARRFPNLFVGIAHGGTPSGGQRLDPATDPLERYVFRPLEALPNLYQQHMHYSRLEDVRMFKERGLLRKLVYGTDAQLGPGIQGAGRFLKILREAGATEEDIQWCCVEYMTSRLKGRWPEER